MVRGLLNVHTVFNLITERYSLPVFVASPILSLTLVEPNFRNWITEIGLQRITSGFHAPCCNNSPSTIKLGFPNWTSEFRGTVIVFDHYLELGLKLTSQSHFDNYTLS